MFFFISPLDKLRSILLSGGGIVNLVWGPGLEIEQIESHLNSFNISYVHDG